MPITCDASLLTQAHCVVACVTHGQANAIKTQLLADIAGGSQNPGTLLNQANCFLCLTRTQLLAIRILLLAIIVDTETEDITDEICCLMECTTPGQLHLIQIYILATKAGVDPDGNLLGPANCFLSCLMGIQNDAVQTYLLAVIAGAPIDPISLLNEASCILQCLSGEQLLAAETVLMCEWSNT